MYVSNLNWQRALQWRRNECEGISNHRCIDCVLNCRRSKKPPKFRVTGLCEGNQPVTGGFPSQRANNAENVSIWWRHHGNVSLKSGGIAAVNVAHANCPKSNYLLLIRAKTRMKFKEYGFVLFFLWEIYITRNWWKYVYGNSHSLRLSRTDIVHCWLSWPSVQCTPHPMQLFCIACDLKWRQNLSQITELYTHIIYWRMYASLDLAELNAT